MSEITREWLEQEIADGDKEALRLLGKGLDPAGSEGTISLPDYVMLARLALIGLDAQERQPLLGQCTFDGCQYDQITALKGQLRTARSDALEEAAKHIVEFDAEKVIEQGYMLDADECAKLIRALKG